MVVQVNGNREHSMLLHFEAGVTTLLGSILLLPLVSYPAEPRMSFSREHCSAEFLSPSVADHCGGFSGLCHSFLCKWGRSCF